MANISEADAANELMRLAKEIARADRLYHTEDAPEITDAAYDALVRRNAALEEQFPHLVRADSPSRKVGNTIAASPLAKVRHAVRMYSLDNAFSDEELTEWAERVHREVGTEIHYLCELKIDGLAINLLYENGRLTRAPSPLHPYIL